MKITVHPNQGEPLNMHFDHFFCKTHCGTIQVPTSRDWTPSCPPARGSDDRLERVRQP